MNNLIENIELHDTLNPKLWEANGELKEEIYNKILQIVREFLKTLAKDNIKIIIKDIILLGSNCSYNYTDDSDLDIHLIVDTEKLRCPDNLYPELYSAYRSLFNKKFDVSLKGIPVEIYVETEGIPRVTNGCYSILQNKWLSVPDKDNLPQIDLNKFNSIYESWVTLYDKLLVYLEKPGNLIQKIKIIDNFINQLYNLRKDSLAKGGEFSLGNLIFKSMRNDGYIDKLKDLKNEFKSSWLSL